MGFYAPAQLIRDARAAPGGSAADRCESQPLGLPAGAHPTATTGVERGQVASSASADLALRLGMRLIVGFPQRCAEAITRARRDGPFRSLEDFTAPHAAERSR